MIIPTTKKSSWYYSRWMRKIEKAENAYPVMKPLNKALHKFQDSVEYRRKCFSALEINTPSFILDGIDLLAQDFGMQKTVRAIAEEADPFTCHVKT